MLGVGAKAGARPELIVVAAAARKLGRPLKWIETRSENLIAMTHGRGQLQDVELGATRDGRLVGLRARVVADVGAYPGIATLLPMLTGQMSSGVYAIPAIDYQAQCVVTNTTPLGAYRGAGRPEAAAMVERAMDMLALELGMDPADLRRRNLIAPDRFPYTTAGGATYDSGEYEKALDKLLEISSYRELRAEQARRRTRQDRVQLGIGLSVYVEVTAMGRPDGRGPHRLMDRNRALRHHLLRSRAETSLAQICQRGAPGRRSSRSASSIPTPTRSSAVPVRLASPAARRLQCIRSRSSCGQSTLTLHRICSRPTRRHRICQHGRRTDPTVDLMDVTGRRRRRPCKVPKAWSQGLRRSRTSRVTEPLRGSLRGWSRLTPRQRRLPGPLLRCRRLRRIINRCSRR
jgi:hypothetical protein